MRGMTPPPLDEFRAAIDSLGNWSVSNIPGVREIRLFWDEPDGVAHMEICLANDSGAAREQAIDALIEIREMFIDDFSISYAFGATDETALTSQERSSSLVFAH